jgi:hypothetical protein
MFRPSCFKTGREVPGHPRFNIFEIVSLVRSNLEFNPNSPIGSLLISSVSQRENSVRILLSPKHTQHIFRQMKAT